MPDAYKQPADEDLSGCELLVQAFPQAGAILTSSLQRLQLVAWLPPDGKDELTKIMEIEKPWDPGACTSPLRAELWHWLDQVATWINTQHLWTVNGPGVPECWSHHPHVVHDLAVVACTRFYAGTSTTPNALDEWHRSTLPAFLYRIAERLGEGCPPGRHSTRPRADRDRRLSHDDHLRHQAATFRGDLLAGSVQIFPAHPGPHAQLDL